jgi:hypothetical protein
VMLVVGWCCVVRQGIGADVEHVLQE